TASYSGFVNGDTVASLDTPVTLSTTATVASAVGTYPITASGAADSNYMISFIAGTLTVTPAGMVPVASITAGGPTTFCAGGSVTLDAGPGFVSYLWSNGAIMQTISVNTSGSFTVRVTDANGYQSLASVPVSVTINPLP